MNNLSFCHIPSQCTNVNIPHMGIKFQWNLKELIKACRKRWWEWIFGIHLHSECLSFLCLACSPLNIFPCSSPRGSHRTFCLAALSPPGSTPLLYEAVQGCDLQLSTQQVHSFSPLGPDSEIVLGHSYSMRDDISVRGFAQSRHAHACRDGSGTTARPWEGEVLLNSPSFKPMCF